MSHSRVQLTGLLVANLQRRYASHLGRAMTKALIVK
jgi:hypothetical protein